MTVVFARAGNCLHHCAKFLPTGEKQRMMCKLDRTLLIKYSQQMSGLEYQAIPAAFTSFMMEPTIPSRSSWLNIYGTLPLLSMSFKQTNMSSETIWVSVKINANGQPRSPHLRYSSCMSVRKSLMSYVLVTKIWKMSCPLMYDAKRASDCLPEPPTPTRKALPRGLDVMREIRQTCSMAWLNNTNFMDA